MEKLVVLFEECDARLDTIITVRVFDTKENFQRVLIAAKDEWNRTEEEFYEILKKHAAAAGYEILFPEYLSFYS